MPADILIVDDTPANLQLLAGLLKERGYKVRPAPHGEVALQAASRQPPDLILLDIHMPDLDGYEVCERLKADERLRDIPVLFISALNETIDKVRAFAVGGVDYITKPFQFEEVEARVSTHLKLRTLQVELAARNRELTEVNSELRRLQELRENLTHMIIHDLRSPLAGIVGYLDLMKMKKSGLEESMVSFIDKAGTAADRFRDMVDSVLDVSRLEAGEMKLDRAECDLVEIAQEAASILASVRGKRQVGVHAPAARVTWPVDRALITRVLQNLVGNAMKFTPDGGSITIGIQPQDGLVRLSVQDTGAGIPPSQHGRIFEKFGQVKSGQPRVGTGLGLTFCKLAVEAHGGTIGVDSEVGKGSTFWFELPKTEMA